MKKFILLALLCLGVACSYTSFAQLEDSPTIFRLGHTAAQKRIIVGEDTTYYTIGGGNTFNTLNMAVGVPENYYMFGFTGDVNYFPTIFTRTPFVSKGYFGDYVELRWNIKSGVDNIERFRIYRGDIDSSNDSTLVGTVEGDEFTFRDETAQLNKLYKYTIFAEGIADELRLPFVNQVQGIGFASPVGTVSGEITYENGAAVENVVVLAETDDNIPSYSAQFNGTDAFLEVPHTTDRTDLELREGFTIQLWTKYEGGGEGTLFNKGADYNLSYNGSNIDFTIGGEMLSLPFEVATDSFFHVTASYAPTGSLSLTAQLRNIPDTVVVSASIPAGTQPAANFDPIFFGKNEADANYFQGNIDEIRLWNRPISEVQREKDFNRFIQGNEEGLVGYWRLNEGKGEGFYDLANNTGDFYENHGTLSENIEWSTLQPLLSQLSYKGITNADGFYTIVGFPYDADGSSYRFTPIFQIHEFEPNQQSRFVTTGNSEFTGVNFIDISTFQVTGTVEYRNSFFPVEGVEVLLNGQPIFVEGEQVLTDVDGKFDILVPIGEQRLQLRKNGHIFEGEGRFPAPTEEEARPTFDFQEPIIGLEFIDNTLVKVAGKVVGGPREAAKPVGFGITKNNLGYGLINITPEKPRDLTRKNEDSVAIYNEKRIVASAKFKNRDVTVYPDSTTGEYVVYLPPEKYVISNVTAGIDENAGGSSSQGYTFDPSQLGSLNLESTFETDTTFTRPVFAIVNGTPSPDFEIPLDESKYDFTFERTLNDTLYTFAVDSFQYEVEKNFIFRVKPDVDMANTDGSKLYGDLTYNYSDNTSEQTIDLIQNGQYAFGFPVFTQGRNYRQEISVFEEYINVNTEEVDRVPVSDGAVEIINNFSSNTARVTLELNEEGSAIYEFNGGSPELTLNNQNPVLSFTKPFSLTAVTGQTRNVRTVWRESNPLRAYVFGGQQTGNTFTTAGPNQVITILRDPPGSNSFAFLEQGTTFETNTSWSNSLDNTNSASATKDLGKRVVTYAGTPAGGTITETEVTNQINGGLEATVSSVVEGEQSTSISFTQSYFTADDNGFVGEAGDLFIGYGTNIVYGTATSIQPVPLDSEECATGECATSSSQGFALGKRRSLNLSPRFGTAFIFTQAQIENVVIPGLLDVRNSFLDYVENPDDIPASNEILYISLVPPTDERYGTSNSNRDVWGDEANPDVGEGPSYRILVPEGFNEDVVSDTIQYFNNQLADWEFWLAHNEEVKVKAVLDENISLDGGATYESTKTISQEESVSRTFTVSINAFASKEAGFDLLGKGATLEIATSTTSTETTTAGTSQGRDVTYGFTLTDGETPFTSGGTAVDFHSIDIMTPSDGFGPVFKLRAGATSCPYEGEVLTDYYEPGQHVLQAATLRVENPGISIVNPVTEGVPENGVAEIVVELSNNTELGESIFYVIAQDDATNPNGALLSMDGSPLEGGGGRQGGVGRRILVPANETITKILRVEKGQADVDAYEDIAILLASECDPTLIDTARFSVFFQPGCTPVRVTSPIDKWIVNTNTTPRNQMRVQFDSYDLQNETFVYAQFQYKPVSSSQWVTSQTFYNPQRYTEAEYAAFDEPKAWLDGSGATAYLFDMSDLPDRQYDVRVVTYCELAPGEFATTTSPVLTGIKDTKPPRLFGAPQPADGVLSANDEIRVVFDEQIAEGLLALNNFSVQGVLNGYELNNNTSINFDGVNNYARIPNGMNLGNASFTIEWWQQRSNFGTEQILFSKGTDNQDALEIGFTASNELFVDFAGERITSSIAFTDDAWQHFAVVYNRSNETISAYMNDLFVIEQAAVSGDIEGDGAVLLGKSFLTDAQHFNGNMHELRIWNRALPLGDVFAQMNNALVGTEIGLVGYWPFDEAFGDIALDKARFRNAVLFTSWLVLPKGSAYAFDGQDDYVSLFTGNTINITEETDFTIEMWFKGAEGQGNATLFSSGKGDGTDEFNSGNWSIGFNEEGQLTILGNGQSVVLDGNQDDYLNDNWQHLAISVNRRGNLQVYINAELRKTVASNNFGGLLGKDMWLGARGYKPNTTSDTQDQFFEGLIDEFRIWRLARTQTQIELYRNAKISSDEIGLNAYYPFEFFERRQGVFFRTPTLGDQWENPFGANGGLATAFGGADFSDDSPNLKQSRPVSKVDFDWAAFENQIIITPSSTMFEAIEQTILEITVDRVEDLQENRLSSPISWTAFIDRNQLKWGNDLLEIEKRLNDELTFEVDIINKGGQQEQFSVNNLPPWLTSSPSSGAIEPLSTLKIRFTVNQGLNTGTYQQDLFLAGNSGFNEKLVLNLRVFNDLPDTWQIDPNQFQYSMNFIGLLNIDGRISTDIFDQLAAFVDDECRGVVELEYVQSIDSYLAFITVYSNSISGEELEFRIWDDSEGIIYTDVTPSFTFQENRSFGVPLQPVAFTAANQLQTLVQIPAGWKWISFGLQSPQMNDLNDLFGELENVNGDRIVSNEAFAVYDDLTQWNGTLSSLNSTSLYKVNFANAQDLYYSGTVPELENTPIIIRKGWNWLGYLTPQNLSVNEALASLDAETGDVIKSQYQFAVYTEGLGWLGSLKFMRPGDGYMYYTEMEAERSFTYPESGVLNGRVATDEPLTALGDWSITPEAYPNNMTVLGEVKGLENQKGYVLAYMGNELRGIAEAIEDVPNQFKYYLTIYGNDTDNGKTLQFDFVDVERNDTQPISETFTFGQDKRLGEFAQPQQLTLQSATAPQSAFEHQWRAYPNPFSEVLEVQFAIRLSQPVESNVTLYNMSGQLIKILWKGELTSGQYNLMWEGFDSKGNRVPQGTYLIRLEAGDTVKNLRVVKQ